MTAPPPPQSYHPNGPSYRRILPRAAKTRGFIPSTDAGDMLGPGMVGDSFKRLSSFGLHDTDERELC
jgi:hypothetical protein